jgi:hypothetical protein
LRGLTDVLLWGIGIANQRQRSNTMR